MQLASQEQVGNENAKVFEFNGEQYIRRMKVFGKKDVVMPRRSDVVQHFHDIYSCPTAASGFKFKHDIQFHLYPEVMNELLLMGDRLRVIVLRRHNALRQAISVANMSRIRTIAGGASNLYDPFGDKANTKLESKLVVDVDSLVRRAKRFQRLFSKFDSEIDPLIPNQSSHLLNVNYSDLLNNEAATAKRVFNFLGVNSDEPVASKIHKATPRKLVDAIENYEELKEALIGTDLEQFLADE